MENSVRLARPRESMAMNCDRDRSYQPRLESFEDRTGRHFLDHVVKPIDIAQLEAVIQRVVGACE